MGQCIAQTKLEIQCKNLAVDKERFCPTHNDNIDWQRAITTIGCIFLGNFIFPGLGGMLGGAAVGYLGDKFIEENKVMTKRVFVSFDFDNDKFLKDSVVGQSKLKDSPFSIADWSLKEEQEEANWKKEARAKIKRSDIVLVMVGEKTYKASGVLAEVKMARDEDIKIVQIKGYPDKTCPKVPDAGTLYKWTWENLKNLLG